MVINQTKKIILLCAPPFSGKDVTAEYLCRKYGWRHAEFKDKLFQLTKDLFCVSENDWLELYKRENKEKPTSLLGDRSPREALILVSERVVKPLFNDHYFGTAAARKISQVWRDYNIPFVFSDSGFVSEVQPLIELAGKENIMIVRIHRPGCTFKGDSRNYIHIDGIHSVDIENNSSVDDLFNKVEKEIGQWLQSE